jgi:hypothetical protein
VKIHEIIRKGKPYSLEHPDIGEVNWKEKLGTWGLYFAKGHDFDQFLVADQSVLLSDDWVVKGNLSTEDLAFIIAEALDHELGFEIKKSFPIIVREIDARKAVGDY